MNQIHSTAIIDAGATLGQNNTIGPFVRIYANVEIGDNNHIEGYASIGSPAEHRDFFGGGKGRTRIGSNNVIREFTTINAPTTGETRMGNHCVMLRGSHLSHDSTLEDRATLSCNVLIGGESTVMEGANIGLGAVIHQRQVIGAYAMVGMGAVVTKGNVVMPGHTYVGAPAKLIKRNQVGLDRAGISEDGLQTITISFNRLRVVRGHK